MKTNKYIRISSKIIYSSTILIYLAITIILVTSLITIPSSVLSEDENDASDVAIIPEEELESMGLKWTYKRPDGSKDNPSTCWKLRWSPDGTKIAVVYFDNTTVILDGKSGKVINALGSAADAVMGEKSDDNKTRTRCWGFSANPKLPLLRACAWSPDGKLLAIAGDHKLIEIFETETWTRTIVLSGHTGSVLSLDFSPDGAWLASGEGTDQVIAHNKDKCKNVIKIWNVLTGAERYTLSGHKDGVMSLHWSSDGTKLVSTGDSADKNLMIWHTNNGTLMSTLGQGLGHSSGVLDASWSPNETWLVSGSRDFKIRLWDAVNGKPIGKPWKDHNCVRSVHWHQSGKYILTAGVDQTIKIRNATNGEEIKIFEEAMTSNSEVMSARWSPDGYKIAACSTRDGAVRLYAIGFDTGDSSESYIDWRISATIFSIIVAIGLIIIYIPLRNEFREHRK